MAAPSDAPCQAWATWAQVREVCPLPEGTDELDAWIQAAILAAITRSLWAKTCKRFGTCTATVRPVPCCVHRRRLCACGKYPYILLGDEPIAGVSEVLIDGDVLAGSAYRVDDFERLVRLDGDGWPTCNDLSLDSTEDGTFEVTFTYGAAIPAEGVLLASLLACSWASDIMAGDCEVPANATNISREGVTIEIQPPTLTTGVTLLDQWLASFECGSGGMFDPGGYRQFVKADT